MAIAGEKDEVPVLIAGGGMVGLSAATFLAQQGVRSVAIERLKASSPLPRAAFFHMRTMEMFRSVGIEDRVREQSQEDFVPEGAIVALDYVAGRKLADIIPNLNEGVDAREPVPAAVPEPAEPRADPARARARGRRHGDPGRRSHRRSAGFERRRVTVKDLASGEQRELHAKYLIAADGAHSRVRDLLGIGYDGRGVFSNSLTIYFRADLSPWIKDNAWSIIYVNNPALGGFFRMNRAGNAGFSRSTPSVTRRSIHKPPATSPRT